MAIRIDEPLQKKQKVIVIPVENKTDLGEPAAGELHKYANPSLIEQEKDAWRKAAAKNMWANRCLLDANAVLRLFVNTD